MYCKVKNCRYPSSHLTLGHQCGKCKNFGHGIFECGNVDLVMNLLVKFKDQQLKPEQHCQIVDCKYKDYHTTDGHKCKKCGRFHSSNECIIDNTIVKQFITTNSILLNCLSHEQYAQLYLGAGCQIYIKKYNSNLSGIFMHSDSWGQYDKDSDDTPIWKLFLHNFKKIMFIKCPICRNQKNVFNKTKIINNNNHKLQCSICLYNNSTTFIKLNYCNHTISCTYCFKIYLKS